MPKLRSLQKLEPVFIHIQQTKVCDGSSKGILFLYSFGKMSKKKLNVVISLYLPEMILGEGSVNKIFNQNTDMCGL